MITFAFCTYRRGDRLEKLVAAMRAQSSPVSFEILAVNNNSPDDTLAILERIATQPGAPLRVVTETTQGIVAARNRAVAESLSSDMLVFIDDDELPHSGLLEAAWDAIHREGARCAGGRVHVDFGKQIRPRWLGDELLGFLAEVDHGNSSFWIKEPTTPVWTANVAYDMALFREHPGLRFDARYSRKGTAIGGGEDVIMFQTLLSMGVPMRYRPDMAVDHFVEGWRLNRLYFLRLHYQFGVQQGLYELPNYSRTLFGVPPFLVGQMLRHLGLTIGYALAGRRNLVRQAMNATHAMGMIEGYAARDGAGAPN